jgi:hypothetical protein
MSERIQCDDCKKTVDVPTVEIEGSTVWEWEPVGWILAWSGITGREVLLCDQCNGDD